MFRQLNNQLKQFVVMTALILLMWACHNISQIKYEKLDDSFECCFEPISSPKCIFYHMKMEKVCQALFDQTEQHINMTSPQYIWMKTLKSILSAVFGLPRKVRNDYNSFAERNALNDELANQLVKLEVIRIKFKEVTDTLINLSENTVKNEFYKNSDQLVAAVNELKKAVESSEN